MTLYATSPILLFLAYKKYFGCLYFSSWYLVLKSPSALLLLPCSITALLQEFVVFMLYRYSDNLMYLYL